MTLPSRSANTMSDAIALSSPSGRMSERTRKAAQDRLARDLFGPDGLQPAPVPQPSKSESLRRHARTLRKLAEQGMSRRKFTKEAERLEALAAELDAK